MATVAVEPKLEAFASDIPDDSRFVRLSFSRIEAVTGDPSEGVMVATAEVLVNKEMLRYRESSLPVVEHVRQLGKAIAATLADQMVAVGPSGLTDMEASCAHLAAVRLAPWVRHHPLDE
jgi:hypothetical protein